MSDERKSAVEWARDPNFMDEYRDHVRSLLIGIPPSLADSIVGAVLPMLVELALAEGVAKARIEELEAREADFRRVVEAAVELYDALDEQRLHDDALHPLFVPIDVLFQSLYARGALLDPMAALPSEQEGEREP